MHLIPTVDPDLLIAAETKVAEDMATEGPSDPTVSVVAALSGRCDPEEMIAISHRLTALANLLSGDEARGWTRKVEGQSYTLVHEDLLRAAASAPLEKAEMLRDLRFSPEIFDIALGATETSGTA